LIERNGVAIVATHSPVVLQEVPKSCVWKLNRSGEALQNSRPAIETFGESVGTLTREVFGLEVTKSGFFQMLSDITEEHDTYEEVLDALGEQLGAEGRALVRILLAERLSK
jgi:predicted ATP-binding protein involved in virulence